MVDTEKRKNGCTGEEGAALFEYALVFSLFCLILSVIVTLGWWWWSQSVAAVAIHDGARDAAARNGDLAGGYETTRTILGSSLGRKNAEEYEGHFRLWIDGGRRTVRGEIDRDLPLFTPFAGWGIFPVRASSFQRNWQFYGGPPGGWE